MFFSVVSHSEDPDETVAAEELIEMAMSKLEGHEPQAGLFFCSFDFEHQTLLEPIIKKWPDLQLIGATSTAELSSEAGFSEDSSVLMLFVSDTIEITAGVGENLSEGIESAVDGAIHQAQPKTDKSVGLCITTPESLTVSGSQMLTCLASKLGRDIPIIGGTAAEDYTMVETRQFFRDQVLSDSVPVLLFSGPVAFSFGVGTGCSLVDKHGEVTKAENNIIYEIDNKPAFSFYKKMLGDDARLVVDIPLAVLQENGEIDYIRTSSGVVDDGSGALNMFADTPEGETVNVATMGPDTLIGSCRSAIKDAQRDYSSQKGPAAAVIFSCAGRKFSLGSRVDEEYSQLHEGSKASLPLIGFYTYGEISPPSQYGKNNRFHNHTFVVGLIGEQ